MIQGIFWLIPLAFLFACGGGGGGDDAPPYNPLWVAVDTQNLATTVTTSQISLYGSAYCDACPPSEGAFGYCPVIAPPQISAVNIFWTNLTTGETGTTGTVITGSCACLFSSCMSVYGNHWAVYSLPLAIGENVIEVRASLGANDATDRVTITRTPAATQGLVAEAGNGAVTLQWADVAGATSYSLYWSTSPDFTKATATRIEGVASPFLHSGLTDGVTYYYAVAAVSGAYESPLSAIVLATPGWRAEVAASSLPSSEQRETSIALDSVGKVHSFIAYSECTHYSTDGNFTYCDGHSYHHDYLTDASGFWSSQPLDWSPYIDANIAVDDADTLHLGYADFPGVIHATGSSGSWSTEVVDAEAGCDSAFALDVANNLHATYFVDSSTTGELRYATNVSGVWVHETVALFPQSLGCGQPGSVDVAVGGDGTPHVVYAGRYPSYGLQHAVKTGGVWSTGMVDSVYVTHLSAAADAAGRVHIVYTDNSWQLRYAHQDDTGGWSVETVEDRSATVPAIALDAAGRAHVSYAGGYQLRYATNAAGAWTSVVLDKSAHSDTALVLDALGKVHISYFSGANLKYISNR